jgi:hypothetical protein
MLDFQARSIHPQSYPSNAGTKHLSMKVIFTPTAEDSLEEVYRYKCEYSVAHSDDF